MQGTFSVANIKTELEAQQTEEQKNSAMAAKFTADAKAQDKILEMDSFLEQAKDNRHCVTLVDDMTKLKPRCHKALKGVRLIVVNARKRQTSQRWPNCKRMCSNARGTTRMFASGPSRWASRALVVASARGRLS